MADSRAARQRRVDCLRLRVRLVSVMEVLEGPTQVQSNIARQTPAMGALQSVWPVKSPTRERTMLESTTFADLAERLRQPAEEMWHI